MTVSSSRTALAIVYATVFMDLLGFGMIIPIMPFLARAYGASGLWVGVLMTAYSGAQFLGAPIIGRLSDRYGRRPVLLLTLLGSSLSFLLMGFAESLAMLAIARLLAGFFGGSIAAAQAYIADVTKPEERSKFMGLLGAAIGLGFVLGPALGALLADFGPHFAAKVAAAICAANLVFACFKLRESRVPGQVHGATESLRLGVVFKSLARPKIAPLIIASFLLTMALVAMEATYALLGADAYGMTSRDLAWAFTLFGVVIVIVQGGLIGRLSKRYGELGVAASGAVVMVATLLALPQMPSLITSVVVLAVFAMGQALASPTSASLLSRAAAADEQGGILGLNQSAAALARAVGPLAAGALYDLGVSWPYAFGALCAAMAAWSLSRHGKLMDTPLAPSPA